MLGISRSAAQPNAGYPHVEEGRTYYDSDPAYYAQQVMGCVKEGARIIGGCCGTTPEYIRQIARLLGVNMPPRVPAAGGKTDSTHEKTCQSRILSRLEQGRRVTLVELDPPRSAGYRQALWRERVSLNRRAQTRLPSRTAQSAAQEWFQPAGLQAFAELGIRKRFHI